jgi:hypothetical protein
MNPCRETPTSKNYVNHKMLETKKTASSARDEQRRRLLIDFVELKALNS